MVDNKKSSRQKSKVIKTIVACSYPLYAEGLSRILTEDKKIDVVSAVSTLIDLIESCK